MGELYPDNFERLLIPGGQNGCEGGNTQYQQTEIVESFQPGQPVSESDLWATEAYGNGDQRISTLSNSC